MRRCCEGLCVMDDAGDAGDAGDMGDAGDAGDFGEVVVELELTLNFVGDPTGDSEGNGNGKSEGRVALPFGFNGR
ncbi:MAG: hypothetical protein FJY48_09370 [Betaproteobacteria bacterium]|nr:hypothetical protein [Betaproteobacteria bacterium]